MIQRWVTERADGRYQSSITNLIYDYRVDAEQAELDWISSKKGGTGLGRSPTFFTHMQTPMNTALQINNQGPHILAQVGLEEALRQSDPTRIDQFYKDHVTKVRGGWADALTEQADDKIEQIEEPEKKRTRYREAVEHNEAMWEEADDLGTRRARNVKKKLLLEALNLDPYGTYGWDWGDPKKHFGANEWKEMLDGKGEKKDSTVEALTDTGYLDAFHKGSFAEDATARRSEILEARQKNKRKRTRPGS